MIYLEQKQLKVLLLSGILLLFVVAAEDPLGYEHHH